MDTRSQFDESSVCVCACVCTHQCCVPVFVCFSQCVCVCVCVYLSVVTQFVALLFTLVGAYEQSQAVSVQQALGHVWPKVAAASPEGVGTAPLLGLGVTPQHVRVEVRVTSRLHACECIGLSALLGSGFETSELTSL